MQQFCRKEYATLINSRSSVDLNGVPSKKNKYKYQNSVMLVK